MKNIILQLPEQFDNYVKEAKSTDITLAVQDKYIHIICKCVIYNKQYTTSTVAKLNAKMSNIIRKITKCLNEIKNIYVIEKAIQPKNGAKVLKKDLDKSEKVQKDSTKIVEKISTPKDKQPRESDAPTFMVAGITLKELANKVRINRYARKMSRTQYASKLGIGYSSLWYLENNIRMPRNPEVVRRILAYTKGV